MSRYDDIIDLKHQESKKHTRMSLLDRAAQFSPFAALTGYEDAIKEAGRVTEEEAILDEMCRDLLDEKWQILKERITDCPHVTITYFEEDDRKSGGKYKTITGVVSKIDEYRQILLMEDGVEIQISAIYNMEGSIFHVLEEPT